MFLYRLIQKFKIIKRFNYILFVLCRAGFGSTFKIIGISKHLSPLHHLARTQPRDENDLPAKLRLAFEQLGPVFIKFGQILSTRADILPDNYRHELEKLQASVASFSYAEAENSVQENLGQPIHKIFKTFEKTPFASASLGQVYKATLFDGQTVAVKVQRPKAKKQIELDTQVLLMISHLLEKHLPGAKKYNFSGVIQEFRHWTLNELDYRKEATNCEIFTNFFKDDRHIYGPKVFWEYSGDSVLTLEFVDGYSLKEIVENPKLIKLNRKKLAHYITDSFVKQFFDYGFFHADPHPSNIFILKNGKILFLDFGMVGFLDDQLAGLAATLFLALMQKDVEGLLSILIKLEARYDDHAGENAGNGQVKINALRKALNPLVLQWSGTGPTGMFTQLFYDLLRVAVSNGVNMPTDFIMLAKAVVTLEIVVKQLDKSFNVAEWEKPMIEKILNKKLNAKNLQSQAQNAGLVLEDLIKRLPDATSAIVENLQSGRFGSETNPRLLLDYERMLNTNQRVNSYGTLLAALIISSALIYQVKGQPELWGLSIAQIGLYGSFVLIVMYLLSNPKRDT